MSAIQDRSTLYGLELDPEPRPGLTARPSSNAVVLDVWASIEPQFGGVGPAASCLATAVSRLSGMKDRQIAVCADFEENRADGIDPRVEKIRDSSPRGLAEFRLSKLLHQAVESADVCHVHGLWLPLCLVVRRLADQMGKPLVSSAHGMLESWEMRNKRVKKSLYSWLLEKPSLSRSSCLRALSEREIGDYRRFGVRKPIALIPNGIRALPRVDPAPFLSQFPELTGKSIVLFLGRIHHKKGVLNLLRAWKAVAACRDDAHLVIAGPNYAETQEKVEQLMVELGIERSVTLPGVISGQTKLQALSAAKFFCLPSYSEGLSVAVLEALSIGLPAIITTACNIPAVSSSGAGVNTSNDPAELADTLIECLKASPNEWCAMSVAAQHLASSQFNWDVIGTTMSSVYEWLLGGGNRPPCVVV